MKKLMIKAFSMMLVLIMLVLPVSVFAEEGVTYKKMGALELGTKIYEASSLEYTVYSFEPTEVGKYTISTTNSLVAIASYTDMWVTIEPTAETVTEASVVWDCTAVGQGILIGALSKADGVAITVSKDDINIITYPTVHYENTKTPEAFKFEGNKDNLIPVDVEDGVKAKAELGLDGYYHLDNANGPILYACLNDPMQPLQALREPGQIFVIIYKENGVDVDYKVDYNSAFDEYWSCIDANTGLYPLTYDLMMMFQNVGDQHNWYGEGGWIGIDKEDGWMYACYYYEGQSFENNELPDEEKEKPGSTSENTPDDGGTDPSRGPTSSIGADGNYTGGPTGTTNNNTRLPGTTNGASTGTGTGTSHQTGDVSVAIICVLATAAVVAVIAFVVIRKKKNTVEF